MVKEEDKEGLSLTLNELLSMRMIPIINGNDAIAPPSSGGSVRLYNTSYVCGKPVSITGYTR